MYPGSPVTNFSTASNPTQTPTEPSPAAVTQNSGISAGSAVGIALGAGLWSLHALCGTYVDAWVRNNGIIGE